MGVVVIGPPELLTAAAAVIAATITAFAGTRIRYRQHKVEVSQAQNEHVQTVLNGYSGVMDELREEINRLNAQIETMRKANEDCERRSDALERELLELRAMHDSEVKDLRVRIADLERNQ